MTEDSQTPSLVHWSQLREAGTLFGFQIMLLVHRFFGRRVFIVFLWPTVIYFMVFRKVARQASRQYLAYLHQFSPTTYPRPPNVLKVVYHFYRFGLAVLDKLIAWSVPMSEDDFVVENRRELDLLLDDNRGQLIIGSHLGNLEYCRGFVQRYKSKTINILVYDAHAANYVAMMHKINPDSRLNIYQVTDLDLPRILQLKNKIDAGEWLFIAGDRIPLSGNERTVQVSFFGKSAPLPIGPYMLAKSLGCPVKLMFAYRFGKKVKFEVVPFADKIELPRKNRDLEIQKIAQQFALELEKHCVFAPYEWFNFYPFWTQVEGANTQSPTSEREDS